MESVLHGFLVSKETVVLRAKSFTVVIQPLSTRLMKPNFCLHGNSRRTCSTQTEDASSVNDKWSLVSAHHPSSSSLFSMSFSLIFL